MDSPRSVRSPLRVDRFMTAIESLTVEREERIRQQAEESRLVMLKGAAARIKSKTDIFFQERIGDIRNTIAAERIAKVNQMHRQLFQERENAAESVFAKVEEEIIAFVAGDAYGDFLLALAKSIASRHDCSAAEVRLRAGDMGYQEQLSAIFPADCRYLSSPDIRLGGLMLWSPERKVLIDERLEVRLEDERQWFYRHSGLKLNW